MDKTTKPVQAKRSNDLKPNAEPVKVKAIFDSAKQSGRGAHGIGCKN